MKSNYLIWLIVAIAIGGLLLILPSKQETPGELDDFAACLSEKGVTMYGADWCSHCQNEKRAFGDSFELVPYVECPDDPQKCLDVGVKSYPTWILPDGQKLEGEQGLEKLAQESGCALPQDSPISSAPTNSFESLSQKFKTELVATGVVAAEYAGKLSDLNWYWAFGLANKNPVLEEGPMRDPRYETANFASTGGWTLATGDAMDHYSHHTFVAFTPDQQERLEKVSKNVYRPCCGNSTYFTDCNHGMAMLGMLEILAADNASESEMYAAAEAANALWFGPQPASSGCTT